ncbi:MAG TPA: tetratricopeptide repeat protein [Chthonomonadaceae bacterium]|nr:tetratricopeptide repeat protein [Chthonomonadaceae bacterium]
MNWGKWARVGVKCTVAAACVLAPVVAGAQDGPAKPPKSSYSTRPKPASRTPEAARHASDEELVDAIVGDSINQLWVQSDRHFHLGEHNHCINLSKIIVQGDPHNMEAYASGAWLLWSHKRNPEAEALLQDGIDANPDTYYMYDEMGQYWLFDRRNPKAAIPFFEKAVKYDCPFMSWNSLANCYEKTGQWEKAVAAWEKATLYPKDLVALRRLKQARTALEKQQGGK